MYAFAHPATALTIAAMMNDEAIAQAQRRRHADRARDKEHARNRRSARRATNAGKRGASVRRALAAVGLTSALVLRLAAMG